MKEIAAKEVIPLDIIQAKCSYMLYKRTTNTHNLTEDELIAILYYSADLGVGHDPTKNIYYILNQRLREREVTKLKIWESFLFHLQAGLAKLPSNQCTVYRGVPDKSYLENYHQNRQIQWSGYSSTTVKIEIAHWFSNRSPSTEGAVMIIDIINGKSISDYSCIKTEHEILLSPNSKFVVNRALYKEEGIWYIKLVEISTEDTLVF